MGLLKSPLAPLGLCTVTMGAVASLILHPIVGLGAILFGACLLFPGLAGRGEGSDDGGR
jgi:hypothetical protein